MLLLLVQRSESTGGILAINRRGQVVLATVAESAMVPFLATQVSVRVNR